MIRLDRILGNYGDIVLATAVVMAMALMVIPMPTWLVDMFLTVNLCLGATLLMTVLYIPNALAFTSLPSIILFSTMFRLSLNVATTRLILLQGDAGNIIDTFGQFVAGGNLVVGVVVFLVITLVQFLVIAKGAERVAEVGARFTLDALPGKQMSIDADLRSEAIDIEEAQARRADLGKESQLYGAMDGAMKFVKGDAIAGLVITAMNIIGGIMIGTLQQGMAAAEAAQQYTILTIGDGMVSQIPALLIAVSSGVFTTRVASDKGLALGLDISAQILSNPKALLISGVVIAGFSMVPGFPKIPFLLIGGLVMATAYTFFRGQSKESGDQPRKPPPAKPPSSSSKDKFSTTIPLIFNLSSSVDLDLDNQEMDKGLAEIRSILYQDLGVPFPGITLRTNYYLDDGAYEILHNEVPVASGILLANHYMATESAAMLESLQIQGIPADDRFGWGPASWVPMDQKERLDQTGVPYYSHTQTMTWHLINIIRNFCYDFVGTQEAKYLMGFMEKDHPELVKELEKHVSVSQLTSILKLLLKEDISIRNLRRIFESIAEFGQPEAHPEAVAEHIRHNLKEQICYSICGSRTLLFAIVMHSELEAFLAESLSQESSGIYLDLDPQFEEALLTQASFSQIDQPPVILTSPNLRRAVWKLFNPKFAGVKVISTNELDDTILISPAGELSIPNPSETLEFPSAGVPELVSPTMDPSQSFLPEDAQEGFQP